MELTHNQFRILNTLHLESGLTQREVSARTGLGLATVNGAMRECAELGLIEDGRSEERRVGKECRL